MLYKDFAITADENVEYSAAETLLKYIKQKSYDNTNLNSHLLPENTPYSRVHLIPAKLINTQNYFEWYHLYNILSALPIFGVLYFAFYKKFSKSFYAILPVILLFLMPRFIGHIPANPKDIPFAVFFTITLCLILSFKRLNNSWRVALIGSLIGYTTGLRLLGATLFIPFGIHIVLYSKTSRIKKLRYFLITGVSSLLIFYATMPILHTNLISGVQKLIVNSANFSYWDRKILFQGQFITKEQRPWYYLFTWIFKTTPLFWLLLTLVPLMKIKEIVKNRYFLLTASTVGVNLLLYLVVQPTIYNGLRHFLYLLPLIAILGSLGLIQLLERWGLTGKLSLGVLGITVFFLFIKVVRLHPYQYIYFNQFSGGLEANYSKYETDYWGASYKEGTEWLIKTIEANKDKSQVYPCEMSFAVQYYAKGKFEIVDSTKKADYILCDYETNRAEKIPGNVIYVVERLDTPLLYVKVNK